MKAEHKVDLQRFCNYEIRVDGHGNDFVRLAVLGDADFGILEMKRGSEGFTANYFTGDREVTTFISDSNHPVTLMAERRDLPILQFRMAEHLKEGFYERLTTSTGLHECTDNDLPALFYGIWTEDDLAALKANRSLKVIIWTGGDINAAEYREDYVREIVLRNVDEVKKLERVVHVSRSSFTDQSLREFGFSFVRVPWLPMDMSQYHPVTKGDSIYIYTSPGFEWYYGSALYEQVVERYPDINFIFACCKAGLDSPGYLKDRSKHRPTYHERKDLIENVYPRCFLALRPTVHDGIANTVQELGLMGIKTVHNGDGPSCLRYQTVDDICAHIERERDFIGTRDDALAEKMREYLTPDPWFLNTRFYTEAVENGRYIDPDEPSVTDGQGASRQFRERLKRAVSSLLRNASVKARP
ncbi:MAG: hypothetical protein JO053_13245 [Acidobacteria bacterium]|nr:hypothetical protein [Acidobacteriota bacterium]